MLSVKDLDFTLLAGELVGKLISQLNAVRAGFAVSEKELVHQNLAGILAASNLNGIFHQMRCEVTELVGLRRRGSRRRLLTRFLSRYQGEQGERKKQGEDLEMPKMRISHDVASLAQGTLGERNLGSRTAKMGVS